MARHAVGFDAAAEVVDTIAAGAFFVPPSPCNVYGWNSRTTGTPIWTWTLANCDASLLYDEYRMIDVSDDGSTAAFSAFIPNGGSASTPSLTVFDAQTGAVRFSKGAADAGAGGGTVGLSSKGAFVTWTSETGLLVFDGATGAKRDEIKVEGPNEISDSGLYVASCTENAASVWAFAGGVYALNLSFTPPPVPASSTWFCVDVSMSSDGSGAEDAELVSYAWISENVLTARVTTYSLVSGKLLTDWVSSTNSQLQTNPTVRMDGKYTAVALWGDNDDVPTSIVLSAGSATPVFNFTTPGSMFGGELSKGGNNLHKLHTEHLSPNDPPPPSDPNSRHRHRPRRLHAHKRCRLLRSRGETHARECHGQRGRCVRVAHQRAQVRGEETSAPLY